MSAPAKKRSRRPSRAAPRVIHAPAPPAGLFALIDARLGLIAGSLVKIGIIGGAVGGLAGFYTGVIGGPVFVTDRQLRTNSDQLEHKLTGIVTATEVRVKQNVGDVERKVDKLVARSDRQRIDVLRLAIQNAFAQRMQFASSISSVEQQIAAGNGDAGYLRSRLAELQTLKSTVDAQYATLQADLKRLEAGDQ